MLLRSQLERAAHLRYKSSISNAWIEVRSSAQLRQIGAKSEHTNDEMIDKLCMIYQSLDLSSLNSAMDLFLTIYAFIC